MRLLALVFACVAAPIACAGEADESAPSELVGVIVDLEPDTGPVRAFTLEARDEPYTLFIAPDVDYGFDLQHLHEHRATRDPVRCTLEARGDRLYALTIVDA